MRKRACLLRAPVPFAPFSGGKFRARHARGAHFRKSELFFCSGTRIDLSGFIIGFITTRNEMDAMWIGCVPGNDGDVILGSPDGLYKITKIDSNAGNRDNSNDSDDFFGDSFRVM